MNIIFLDIDGVLNCDRDKDLYIDADRMILVRDICRATGACVVLTSVWRRTWPNIVNGYMIDIGVPFIDKTLQSQGPRGLEIMAWLEDKDFVSNYVILDDDHDFTEDQIENKLVWVRNGLEQYHVEDAIKILRGEK